MPIDINNVSMAIYIVNIFANTFVNIDETFSETFFPHSLSRADPSHYILLLFDVWSLPSFTLDSTHHNTGAAVSLLFWFLVVTLFYLPDCFFSFVLDGVKERKDVASQGESLAIGVGENDS